MTIETCLLYLAALAVFFNRHRPFRTEDGTHCGRNVAPPLRRRDGGKQPCRRQRSLPLAPRKPSNYTAMGPT